MNRLGRHITRNGEPCDHIPLNAEHPAKTEKHEHGKTYYKMAFGPYDAPRIEWVNAGNVYGNPAARMEDKRIL